VPVTVGRGLFVPKGLKDLAWGFNPRNMPNKLVRPESSSSPLRGRNSEKAQYSDTPVLQHSARKESRTRTTTKTRAKRLTRAKGIPARLTIRLLNFHTRNARVYRPCRAVLFLNRYLGLEPQAESLSPFGTNSDSPAVAILIASSRRHSRETACAPVSNGYLLPPSDSVNSHPCGSLGSEKI
jgi:hypothetical protein